MSATRSIRARFPLSALSIALPALLALSAPATRGQDLVAVNLEFTPVGGGMYDVGPVIHVAAGALPVPAHAALLVNGELQFMDTMHEYVVAPGFDCGDAPNCLPDGSLCALTGVTDHDPQSYLGQCQRQRLSFCDCFSENIHMWLMPGIRLDPGDSVRLVLDPDNLVEEADETNNVFETTFSPPLPALGGSLRVALATSLILAGALVLRRRGGERRGAAAGV